MALKEHISSNWSDYSVIFLPSNESGYKQNTTMFLKAFNYSKEKSATNVYFQGENLNEVNVARSLGLISHEIKIIDAMTNYLLLPGIE